MNKIQDGYFAGGDSYKPLTLSSDRQNFATLSFVGDKIIVRAVRGAELELVHAEGNICFKIISPPEPAVEAKSAEEQAA